MSKYSRLRDYLLSLKDDRWLARFQEIEDILGFPLPASAHLYPAWWSNTSIRHTHAAGWLDAGFLAEALDLKSAKVTFRRDTAERRSKQPAPNAATDVEVLPPPMLPDPADDEAVALVACVKSKLPQAAPAGELYTSSLFRKSRRLAQRHASRWFILSALHGLLEPTDIVAPYEKKPGGCQPR